MVSSKERQRQLARAKWERQQARRAARARRSRRVQVVVGTILGLVAAAALVWVVLWIVEQENERNPAPVAPTDGERPSFVSPPPTTPSAAPTTPQSPQGSGEQNATTAPTRTGGTASTPTQGTP